MARRDQKKKDVNTEEQKWLVKLKDMVEKVYYGDEWQEKVKNMERWYKQYTGAWWDEKKLKDDESPVFINLIFSTIQTNAPLLTDNRPTWYIRAREAHFQNYLNVYNKALEYLWDKNELDPKIFRTVIDSQLFYFGVMKVYFCPEYDDVRHDLCDPREMVWAPGYDDVQSVAWIGEVKRKPLSWIKYTYPDKADQVKADHELDPDKHGKLDKYEGFSDIEDFCTVYEIWMRDEEIEEYIVEEQNDEGETEKVKKQKKKYPYGRIVTFTNTVILDDRASPYKHGRHPYIFFYDYVDPHNIWGMGEPAQTENINKELNLRLQDLAWFARKHARPNYVFDAASGLDPEEVKKDLPKGDNMWALNNMATNPKPVQMLEVPQINPIHNEMIGALMQGHEEVSGVTDVSKGMATKKERQSASEVSILIESSYTRTRQRVRNLEHSIKQLCHLTVEIMQQYYKSPRSFAYRKDDEMTYGKVSNTPEMLMAATPKPAGIPINLNADKAQKRQQEREDYMAVIEYLKDKDEVYADFDIEIQTNSTLPMDRQSLANLALRLFEIKAIDRTAMLEVLNFPRAEEIEERMSQKEKQLAMMKQAQGGIPGMPKPGAKPQGGPPRPMRISQ